MSVYKAAPDHLSIHETVWHLADSEVVEYVHCRRFITKPGSPALGIDSSPWSHNHGYFYQDIKEAVRIIRALRTVVNRSLRTLPEIAWASTAEVPIYGRISLDEWLVIRERMEGIYSEWLEFTASAKAAAAMRKAGVCGLAGSSRLLRTTKAIAVKVEHSTITPFSFTVPQGTLDDLKLRLQRAQLPDRETVRDWSQGIPLDKLRALSLYWRTSYDWKRCEVTLNRFSQFHADTSRSRSSRNSPQLSACIPTGPSSTPNARRTASCEPSCALPNPAQCAT